MASSDLQPLQPKVSPCLYDTVSGVQRVAVLFRFQFTVGSVTSSSDPRPTVSCPVACLEEPVNYCIGRTVEVLHKRCNTRLCLLVWRSPDGIRNYGIPRLRPGDVALTEDVVGCLDGSRFLGRIALLGSDSGIINLRVRYNKNGKPSGVWFVRPLHTLPP